MSRASFTLNSQSIRDPHLQYCCLVALQWMGGMKLCAVAPSSPQLGPFLKMFEFWKILMWGFNVAKKCIWNVRKCDKTQTFQNIIMPPKSACLQWWQQNEAAYLAKGPAGKALVALAKRWIWDAPPKKILAVFGDCPLGGGSFPLNQFFSIRYLTPPATSTAVERLFSAAGLIMEAKRNRLCPKFVDKLLFLREAHLLGICKLDWQ